MDQQLNRQVGQSDIPDMENPRAATQSAAPPAAIPADAADRRRSSRQHQLAVATLQPASGDTQIECQVLVCNLSLGGVGFRCSQKIRVGETYRITLGTGPLFLNARIRIMNVRSRPDGAFDVGAEFN